MEAIRRVISKINHHLSDLTPSQRLAIGLCVVIIVGSFLWMVRWSAEPEWVRLLEEPMSVDQVATARTVLPEGRIRIAGDHILVSPAERHEFFWKLQAAGALPADTSITFEKLIEDDSPFRPESENHFRRRVALQNELAKVIASSAIVRTAEVFITDSSDRRIGRRHTSPTASIQVTLVPGRELDAEMVKACASIVAGAVPGLAIQNISVVDGVTLRTHTPPDPTDSFAQGLLQETMKTEDHLQRKLEEQLSYIPGVRVAVTVQLDPAKKQTRELTYGEPAVAEERTNTSETRSGTRSGESGVGPNVGQSLATGTDVQTSNTDETNTKFHDQSLTSETTTVHLPLQPQRVTASIGIPWSYVAGVVKRLKGLTDEPSVADIEAQFGTEANRVRATAKNIVLARVDGDVTVELFPDAMTIQPDGTVATAGVSVDGGGLPSMIREYGAEGGLAFLAFAGLVMLSRMARRSAREAIRGQAGQAKTGGAVEVEESIYEATPTPVGRASPTATSLLMGKEIDEASLRGGEMARQVSQFVMDNPNAAASLVRRWADAGE